MSELTGAELDLAVANIVKPEGINYIKDGKAHTGGYWSGHSPPIAICGRWWHPSTNWGQGGPLIEEYRIDLWDTGDGEWGASMDSNSDCFTGTGPTPLIAACRAIVASKSKYD